MTTTRTNAVWDKSRCRDIENLRLLLREVGAINSGSHCLERIARCIALAKELEATDYRTGRVGLVYFLHDLAVADRSPSISASDTPSKQEPTP